MRAPYSSSTPASRRSFLLRWNKACAKFFTARGLATITWKRASRSSHSATSKPYSPVASAHPHRSTRCRQIVAQLLMSASRVGKIARPFSPAAPLYPHHQFFGAHIDAAHIGLVQVRLPAVRWLRLPDPVSSPVELEHSGLCLRFSSAWWRRGRGAYLKPRLSCSTRASRLIGLPRNTALLPPCSYYEANIQAPEVGFLPRVFSSL